MYIFNWKFGGMDFDVPEYISRNYNSKSLKQVVRNITKDYGKDRLTIPAQDLAGGCGHSYEAVKDMKDISFIEDGRKIIFIGKSEADSFEFCKTSEGYLRYSWYPGLTKKVYIRHKDKQVNENCYFMGKDGRIGFLVATETQCGIENEGFYELFDIRKSDGTEIMHKKIKLQFSRLERERPPKVVGRDGVIVLCGVDVGSSGLYLPTKTSADLLYDWDANDFKATNERTRIDYASIGPL